MPETTAAADGGIVDYGVDDGLAVCTLTDVAGGNVLNERSLADLAGALAGALADDAVRAVLLRARGPRFCMGMDFGFVAEVGADLVSGDLAARGASAVAAYSGLLSSIADAPKPVIALVDGDVKAGGVGLVAACDIVVASDKTTFELSEALFGLLPANVLPFLAPARLSWQRARYLVLTCKRLDAARAKEEGLVDEVFTGDALEKGVREIVRGLFRCAPHALAQTKAFAARVAGLPREAALADAKATLLALVSRPDNQSAIAGFREGVMPPWFGKFKPTNPLASEVPDGQQG